MGILDHRKVILILLISFLSGPPPLSFFMYLFPYFYDYIYQEFIWVKMGSGWIFHHSLVRGNEDDCCHRMKYLYVFKSNFIKKFMKNKWMPVESKNTAYGTYRVSDTDCLVPCAWWLEKFVINLPTNLYHPMP